MFSHASFNHIPLFVLGMLKRRQVNMTHRKAQYCGKYLRAAYDQFASHKHPKIK
jgi:hypothetical protein